MYFCLHGNQSDSPKISDRSNYCSIYCFIKAFFFFGSKRQMLKIIAKIIIDNAKNFVRANNELRYLRL